jgi:hypothetical protein
MSGNFRAFYAILSWIEFQKYVCDLLRPIPNPPIILSSIIEKLELLSIKRKI